jgi:excinuclease UvrABC helicase subunit UvrB
MFDLVSDYAPAGNQPQAIAKLTQGILSGAKHQGLLGVTGSGKTFTIANVIRNVSKPALVLSHNKMLALPSSPFAALTPATTAAIVSSWLPKLFIRTS